MSGPDRDRLDQALTELRDRGVAVVWDLTGSSGVRDWDCDDYLKAATAAGTDLWVGTHVGSDEHGGAYWDERGVLRYRHDDTPVDDVYWVHNHRQPAAGRLLVEALTAVGLDVSWNGNPDQSVLLTLSGAR
jgi:hypothetical protein